jgi:hypothetical protein
MNMRNARMTYIVKQSEYHVKVRRKKNRAVCDDMGVVVLCEPMSIVLCSF